MISTDLRILNQVEVARATGYSMRFIQKCLGADEADGTPGVRFPLPLRDPLNRPPARGRRVEWSAESVRRWIEARKQ
jgi:hypothetical protein